MADVTEVLSLEVIDSSDYVTPDVINANFQKLDKLGIDYVTEAGKSGEWWYRKWKSGRMEMGIDNKQFAKSGVHDWGSNSSGLWATNQYNFGAYPFAFTARPHVSISFLQDTSRNGRGSTVVIFNNDAPTTRSPNFEVVDSWNEDIQPICSIFVAGSYK